MIHVGGHRRSGCTDNNQAEPYAHHKPAENTIPSIKKAIQDGATYIEVDAVQTKDDEVAITHSNNLSLHIFGEENPGLVSDYTLKELKNLRVGPNQDGVIPSLEEVIEVCKDVILNVEIKDVKGTSDKKFKPGKPLLLELLADKLADYQGKLILSSFSLWDIQKAAELMPDTPRGMLFEGRRGRKIYQEKEDPSRHLDFTLETLQMVVDSVEVPYIHPCLGYTPPDVLKRCKELGLLLNAWSLFELPPEENPKPIEKCVRVCLDSDTPLTIMTDFIPEMRQFLARYNQNG